MKRSLSIFLLMIYAVGFAQRPVRLMVVKDESMLPYAPMDLSRSEDIDSTRLIVKYHLSYLQGNNSQLRRNEVIILQIGHDVTKCYGLKRFLANLNASHLHSNKTQKIAHTEEYKQAGDGTVAYEVIMYRNTNTLLYLHQMPAWFSKRIGYEEKIPEINWQIGSNCDSLYGYSCFEAKGRYGGREWNVVFTNDVPIGTGPWKLGGLPGLILSAEDSKRQYRFECIEVKRAVEPIKLYAISTDMTTKTKWLQMERTMHTSPYFYFSNGGVAEFSTKNGDLDSSWVIPYNPIELE